MDFRILGPLEVVQDGAPIALGGPRQRALLALLLLRANEPVSRDWLIEELWEERPPRSGATALHNNVARLRRTLGPERLLTRPEGYMLRIEPGELDLDGFRELVAASEGAPLEDRVARLREALALWRGEPLAGSAFGGFARSEAARIEELRIGVLEDLVEVELELGRHAELVSELTALVAAHPLSERLRAHLILALYRCGRQAEALDVYRETRLLLAEELGLDPSPELKELERAILRHDPALALARRSSPPAQATPARRSLRRTAYLAAAALVLATAGASAGLLLTRDRGPEAARALPPPSGAAAGEAEPTSSQAPTTQAAKPSRRPVTSTTTNSSAEPKPKARPTRRARPATVTHVPVATTAPEPEPATTQRPEQPTVPKAAKPFTISDDFSRPVIDPLVWHVIGRDNGAVFAQGDGRLEITVLPDAAPDPTWNQVGGHYGTRCQFTGDFDVRVDFELLTWPSSSGVYAGLNAIYADTAVVRQSSAQWGDQYASWVIPANGSIPLDDRAGRLRIKRVDGVMTTYFWNTDAWTRIVSGTSRGAATLALQAQANGDEFEHVEVRVAFDNFVVTATDATCPPGSDPRG